MLVAIISLAVAIAISMIAMFLERHLNEKRIKKHIRRFNGRLMSCERASAGTYRIIYTDQQGRLQHARVESSLLSGVRFIL